MDEDGSRKIPVVSVQDLLGELSAFVPEIARQAFAEKLASLGAAGLPRTTVGATSMHSTVMVISSVMFVQAR